MPSSSSSDSDGGYSNFKKYKKRQLKTVRKAKPAVQPVTTSSKPFQSKLLKNAKIDDSEGSASDKEMTVEQLIAERKKNKPKQEEEKPFEIEYLDDSLEASALNEEISLKDKKKNKKKAEKEQLPSPPKKSRALLEELRCLEKEVLQEDQAHRFAVQHIANKTVKPVPVIDLDNEGSISVILELLNDKDFHLNFKMNYEEPFEVVFLDHASKAGYDKPENIKVLWETEEEYVNVKYFDTPEKLKMPNGGVVKLIISPREGAVREKRNDGEIKIKLNMQSQKNPLERFIHKEMPFGEFKVKLCDELKIAASKMRFTFDGENVGDDMCPDDLDMEDFDILDVHVKA